jgi:hypothetical protein
MKLAVMQPYFFPYLGYFSLIKHTDLFILLDITQYNQCGWISRNRILKPSDCWQYIKVPVRKHALKTRIKDILIQNNLPWRTRILAQLEHYRKKAPFYRIITSLLEELFSNDFKSVVDLDFKTLKGVCSYLGIQTPFRIFSEMNLLIDTPNHPDEWALNTCKRITGVTEYWNPPGGMNFYDRSKYKANNITLKFHQLNLENYSQNRSPFEPGLSVLDVMMFNSVETINRMLDNYELF